MLVFSDSQGASWVSLSTRRASGSTWFFRNATQEAAGFPLLSAYWTAETLESDLGVCPHKSAFRSHVASASALLRLHYYSNGFIQYFLLGSHCLPTSGSPPHPIPFKAWVDGLKIFFAPASLSLPVFLLNWYAVRETSPSGELGVLEEVDRFALVCFYLSQHFAHTRHLVKVPGSIPHPLISVLPLSSDNTFF